MQDQPQPSGHDAGPNPVNGQASVWMMRGIALLDENTPASLAQSIHCFDRAIELRQTLPLAENHIFRYGLAAGWMNRGDAFTRLRRDLPEALRSYDQALAVLGDLPVEADPRFRRRHAVAWLNRGITLQAQNTPATLAAARESFERSIALMNVSVVEKTAEDRRIQAAAWMNLGNVLLPGDSLSAASALAAFAAAQKALFIVSGDEEREPSVAAVGLKARHLLCRAAACLLESPADAAPAPAELVAQATDAVDDAMKLVRHWNGQGVREFQPLSVELFRFGCLIYQTCQPHFLTEFLLENLDPAVAPHVVDPVLHAAAVEALWRSVRGIQRDGFKAVNTPRFEEMLARLKDLRITEERLRDLRTKCVAP